MKEFVDTSILLIVSNAESYDVSQVDKMFEDEIMSGELEVSGDPVGEIISTLEEVRDTLMKLHTITDYRVLPSYKNRRFKNERGFTDADIECICK